MGFLPCCQNEEDKNARDALNQLNTVGARIIWHRSQNRLVENVKRKAFSIFGRSKADDDGDDNNPIVKAYFKLVDNEDGIPEIQIGKRTVLDSSNCTGAAGLNDEFESDFNLGMDDPEAPSPTSKSSEKKKAGTQPKSAISLKRIHTAVPLHEEMIVLNILEPDGQTTQEWVKFALDAKNQGARNIFLLNLQVLMEWDRQRRNACGELEYDETAAASTIKAKAQKAKHRIEREYEMKQTRRQREERKAKYVQESGGLKYTALAMARNAAEK